MACCHVLCWLRPGCHLIPCKCGLAVVLCHGVLCIMYSVLTERVCVGVGVCFTGVQLLSEAASLTPLTCAECLTALLYLPLLLPDCICCSPAIRPGSLPPRAALQVCGCVVCSAASAAAADDWPSAHLLPTTSACGGTAGRWGSR